MKRSRNFAFRADWPFDIRRLPFFYGWVIWLFSTLGFLFSIPGQTMGMAVFTDHLIDALGLSRTQLSLAYLLGTVGSSFFLARAGRWYDVLGGRIMVTLSSLALCLMLLFISVTDGLSAIFGGSAIAGFSFIMLGYFGVRFFGQGVLTSASRNILLHWFERRRGLVGSMRGVFVSLGFSLAPLFLAWLISLSNWRVALWQLALACAVFAVIAWLILRDNPESCQVEVDGYARGKKPEGIALARSLTLSEARATPVFWVLSLSLSMHSLFITAITFHVVSLFAEAGRSAVEAFAYFLPTAVISTTTNLLAGWLADKHVLKPFLIAMLLAFISGAVGVLYLQSDWGYWLMVAGFGIGSGLWSVVSNLAFIRNFGPLHLGEVSGLCTSIMVFSSAIGPALFSVGLDYTGSYAAAQYICMAGLIMLLYAAVMVPHREADIAFGSA